MGKKGIWIKIILLGPNENNSDKITVLADTGSSWSLIGGEMKEYAIKVRELPEGLSLIGAEGSPIMGIGIGTFYIKIGYTVIKTDFFMVHPDVNWKYPILGLSLLEKLGTTINLGSKTLTFDIFGEQESITFSQYIYEKEDDVNLIFSSHDPQDSMDEEPVRLTSLTSKLSTNKEPFLLMPSTSKSATRHGDIQRWVDCVDPAAHSSEEEEEEEEAEAPSIIFEQPGNAPQGNQQGNQQSGRRKEPSLIVLEETRQPER